MTELLERVAVMPIIWIHDADRAVPVARALVEGGVTVFEILMRTPAALAAIAAIRRQVPEATVGAGTVLRAADVQSALDAGAQFGVSPGLLPDLAQAAVHKQLPLLPGVWTASEVMQALTWGFEALKLFPANGLEGVKQIEHLQGVFPRARFCPTGGIKPEHIASYLALRACPTVGGSWVTPRPLVAAGDYKAITALARRAAAFAASRPQ
ncbi:MAG: bifunctional 4-hydroxy-2-oxoglutarate aldolase/2-dehydro-3-deoxy-phosphogluconate aldolase [Burkholderiaceae bacterium]